jgi:cadmium resistance protein CadD (predicted permease)
MEHLATLLVLAIGLFVSTNLDDLFILRGFLSKPKFRLRQIVAGQLAGVGALYAAAVVLSLVALVIPAAWIGFLGLLPIAIGLKELWELRQPDEAEDDNAADSSRARGRGDVLTVAAMTVAAMTVANGGDNLSIYTPVFATRSGLDVAISGLVFAAMTLAWVGAAIWLTRHRTLGAPIRRDGARVTPFVFIGLGAWILHEARVGGAGAKLAVRCRFVAGQDLAPRRARCRVRRSGLPTTSA